MRSWGGEPRRRERMQQAVACHSTGRGVPFRVPNSSPSTADDARVNGCVAEGKEGGGMGGWAEKNA